MQIKKIYKGTINGSLGFWIDTYPEEAIITEENSVLYPSEDMQLQNKETKEKSPSVIIQDESEQDNWEEVEREKLPWEKEIDNG